MTTTSPRYAFPRPEPTDSFQNWDSQVAEVYQTIDKYYGLRGEENLPDGVCDGDVFVEDNTGLVARMFGGLYSVGIGSAGSFVLGLENYDVWYTRETHTGSAEAPIVFTSRFTVYPSAAYRITFVADVRWSSARAGYFGTRIRTHFGSGDIDFSSPELRTFRHYIDNTGNGSSPVGGSTLMFFTGEEPTDCQVAVTGTPEGSNNWVTSDNRKTNANARGDSNLYVQHVGFF